MSKHRKQHFKGKARVEMKQLGSIIFAARVQECGVWTMAQGIWVSQLRRRPLT